MKRPVLFILLWLLCKICSAHQINGTVQSATSKAAIAGASVFLANTSIGMVTGNDGKFELDNIPAGRFELIVSFVGFETYKAELEFPSKTLELNVVLNEKPNELENIVVEAYDEETWARWGDFFLEQFIGPGNNAASCKIKNIPAIHFRFYKKSNRLVVLCDEPLEIENRMLGYNISYQMETFEYNFNTRRLSQEGYSLFNEVKNSSERRKQRWKDRRNEVYTGSLLHFMRSVYRNTIIQEGFEVHFMQKEPNLEKQRIRNLVRNGSTGATTPDSSAYFNRVMRQPDELEMVDTCVLTGDRIAYAINNHTAGLFFPDYLYIIVKKPEALDYARMMNRSAYPQQVSYLTLLEKQEIAVLSNGNYFPSLNLLLTGYWTFTTRMATMLPLDYETAAKPIMPTGSVNRAIDLN